MSKIKVAIVGVGNCASSLVQGIHFYDGERLSEAIGLMHREIGGYVPGDVEVVAAFDIDRRKVGRDVADAIFAAPNCTAVFYPHVPATGVEVQMGRVLDGCSEHMADYADERRFLVASTAEPDEAEVVRELRRSGAEIVLNYLPVGSEEATPKKRRASTPAARWPQAAASSTTSRSSSRATPNGRRDSRRPAFR
jgi:myo-inositol-1-phosphate synthase